MNPKRKVVLERRRRQVPPPQTLDSYVNERLSFDDYDRFMLFCRDVNPSLNARSKVSSAAFEHLLEQFEESKAMAY
jgi:hypothetical protein